MSLREAASESGISFNTLARVEKDHIPDLPKFKRLVEWCGADIRRFLEAHGTTTTPQAIAQQLRADPTLPPGAAERISGIVDDLYSILARPREIAAAHLQVARTLRPEADRTLGTLLGDLNGALAEQGSQRRRGESTDPRDVRAALGKPGRFSNDSRQPAFAGGRTNF